MKSVNYSAAVLAGTIIALVLSSPSVKADPALTKERVIQIAIGFCQAIGTPVNGVPNIQFPAPIDPFPDWNYWQPRWRLTFPGQAEVEVVDASGIVSEYDNTAAYAPGHGDAPAGPAISEASAIALAAGVIQAAGIANDVGDPAARSSQLGTPPTARGHTYFVRHSRMFQGIDCKDQFANVDMEAETGIILGYAIHFNFDLPTVVTVNITADQASQISLAVIRAGIAQGIATPEKIGLVAQPPIKGIVQPNGLWSTVDATPLPTGSRVAWTTWITDGPVRFGIEAFQIFVDTETGHVIGGDTVEYAVHKGRSIHSQNKPVPSQAVTPNIDHMKTMRAHRDAILRQFAAIKKAEMNKVVETYKQRHSRKKGAKNRKRVVGVKS